MAGILANEKGNVYCQKKEKDFFHGFSFLMV